MSLWSKRGEAFVRVTAPGVVVLSWYPHRKDDPNWPGLILDTGTIRDFPRSAFEAGDEATVGAWVIVQKWAQPLL